MTIEPDLPYLACRRIHVKQIFENLIGNAIKYMGNQPHPQVEIGSLEDQRGVQVFVRDNGMGIEPSMIEGSFSRLSDSKRGTLPGPDRSLDRENGGGTVRGAVSVDSTPGVGSTFYVRLPVISWNPSLLPQAPVQAGVTASVKWTDR